MFQLVILTGNLGSDPELRYTQNNNPICTLSVATSKYKKGKDGAKGENITSWHRVKVWGLQAESCSKYLAKGKQVQVIGELEYGSYEKDGVKHYTTDIVAQRVNFLGQSSHQGEGYKPPREDPANNVNESQSLDQIPF